MILRFFPGHAQLLLDEIQITGLVWLLDCWFTVLLVNLQINQIIYLFGLSGCEHSLTRIGVWYFDLMRLMLPWPIALRRLVNEDRPRWFVLMIVLAGWCLAVRVWISILKFNFGKVNIFLSLFDHLNSLVPFLLKPKFSLFNFFFLQSDPFLNLLLSIFISFRCHLFIIQ